MKNIKVLTLFTFLVVSISGYAQKIKLKKGDVLVDKELWLKYDGCGGWDQVCSIYNLQGEEIIFMKRLEIPYSDDEYWKIKFLGTQKTIELEYGFQNINRSLLKKFYLAGVVNEDGTLNIEKVDRMVEKYGNPYSKTNQPETQTIIIKEESPKSDININIGN